MKVEIGKKYKHFKGTIYKVICIAKNSETLEDMVIYENEGKVWARPYDLFISKVDKEKYPNVEQVYRFEKIDD